MKRQAYTMIAMIVLVGSMAVAAKAQMSGRVQLIANIPFEFNINDKTLPAGEYRVQPVNGNTSQVLRIQSNDGKESTIVLMMSSTSGM